MTPKEIEQKRCQLMQLEESFGRASQKYIVEPIVKKLDAQHDEQKSCHQLTQGLLLGMVDPKDLGCSTSAALTATLEAEIAVKARKQALKEALKAEKEVEAKKKREEKEAEAQKKRDARAAEAALKAESKKKTKKTQSETDAQPEVSQSGRPQDDVAEDNIDADESEEK
jgi:sRNA-binding protein